MEQQAAARLTEMDVEYRDREESSGDVNVRFVYQPSGGMDMEEFETQLRETFETHIAGLNGVEDVSSLFTITPDAGEIEVVAESDQEPGRSTLVTMMSSVAIDVMLGEAPKAVLGFEQYVSQQAQMVRQQTDVKAAVGGAQPPQQNDAQSRTRRLRRRGNADEGGRDGDDAEAGVEETE